MPQIGALSSSGSAGVWHKEIMVRAPELRLGDAELYQIPMSIREEDPKGVNHNDIMGNLMLKRFNADLVGTRSRADHSATRITPVARRQVARDVPFHAGG
jgi:hypothetical protein